MTDDIKALRDILLRVGEPEGTFCLHGRCHVYAG